MMEYAWKTWKALGKEANPLTVLLEDYAIILSMEIERLPWSSTSCDNRQI